MATIDLVDEEGDERLVEQLRRRQVDRHGWQLDALRRSLGHVAEDRPDAPLAEGTHQPELLGEGDELHGVDLPEVGVAPPGQRLERRDHAGGHIDDGLQVQLEQIVLDRVLQRPLEQELAGLDHAHVRMEPRDLRPRGLSVSQREQRLADDSFDLVTRPGQRHTTDRRGPEARGAEVERVADGFQHRDTVIHHVLLVVDTRMGDEELCRPDVGHDVERRSELLDPARGDADERADELVADQGHQRCQAIQLDRHDRDRTVPEELGHLLGHTCAVRQARRGFVPGAERQVAQQAVVLRHVVEDDELRQRLGVDQDRLDAHHDRDPVAAQHRHGIAAVPGHVGPQQLLEAGPAELLGHGAHELGEAPGDGEDPFLPVEQRCRGRREGERTRVDRGAPDPGWKRVRTPHAGDCEPHLQSAQPPVHPAWLVQPRQQSTRSVPPARCAARSSARVRTPERRSSSLTS